MKALVFFVAGLMADTAVAISKPDHTARRAKATVTVLLSDQAQAADKLVTAAERLGGFFVERNNYRVVARVPQAQLDAFLQEVAALGTVVERSLKQEDIVAGRAQAAAVVASQEEMLKRYLSDLTHAKDREDMAIIEAAARELIFKIEQGKGALRAADHDLRYAAVDVSFKLRERSAVAVRYQNRHAWLNTIGLDRTLADFAAPVVED
jgi:hypothetical protein